MKIQKACPEDADALTEIAIAAKKSWGYPNDWIRLWRKELTITPDYVIAHPTYAAAVDDHLVGFCAVLIGANAAVLDHLWVLPERMRTGVGRALFTQAETVAREAGADRMTMVGEPHAEGFYRAMGARLYGREPATVDGHERFLPLFEKILS
jgi:GNAT superfamily N-acetyltransferase